METSLGFIETEEREIRTIKFWRMEYAGERAGGCINLGFSCLACIDIVLRYAKQYVDRRWDGGRPLC